jgi:hypothetical protein
MSDTEPVTNNGQTFLVTARVPDLLGFVNLRSLWHCGLVSTGDVLCWPSWSGVPWSGRHEQLSNVALP